MNDQDHAKRYAGRTSADLIEDGMTIGLGSGSTVYWMIQKLGERVANGLDVRGVPSSEQTKAWAEAFGVPLTDFSQVTKLDLAIDGADEVDPQWQLVKGGGGALVREKIIAASAERFIIIVDESKTVTQLGAFPLPIEIVPFGWKTTAERIAKTGASPVVRRNNDGNLFVSDNGNYIVDCDVEVIREPQVLEKQINQLPGVVETGLFTNMACNIIVGHSNGAEEWGQS